VLPEKSTFTFRCWILNNLNTLYTDIASLVKTGEAFGHLEPIENAAMLVEDSKIAWVGKASAAPAADQVLSLSGKCVIPGFVDSHSHLIFGGERSEEFAHRMAGQPYASGGIRTTVKATREASDQELRDNAKRLVQEFYASGITHFEIKSGYGLDVETEVRSLRIASEFTEDVTYLGAHVVPEGVDRVEYLELVTGEMLNACKPNAKWVDVFCDRGAFVVHEAREILEAGIAAGLKPRMHANQLENLGAIALAVELDCASVDHCTHLSAEDIAFLSGSNTVATLVPGAEFSTRSPYPDARRLVAAGVTVALATDCNPGSSFTTSMPFCIAIAVREMGLTPDQALWAATRGGAMALRNGKGTLDVGATADFAVLDAPNHIHLAYRPGVQLVEKTFVAGKQVFERNK
jgi:imidazolonepropionase